jgi:hypothetical protein
MSKELEKCDQLIARLQELNKSTSAPLKKTVSKQNLALAQEELERQRAQNLANLLQKNNILGTRPVPRQPTDEEMFGALVPSEEQVQKAEKQWSGSFNNWLAEAQKPINSRFKSQEEEEAYWKNIKISDNGDGNSGF